MPKRVDLTGDIYGDFTVIEMLYGYQHCSSSKSRTYCRCLGVDGKEYIIRADALRRGVTKSVKNACRPCGPEDLRGIKYGLLTPLYPISKRSSNGGIRWHCACDCGNYIDVNANNLKRGHTRSCGCNKESQWETFISDILKGANIEFYSQYRFKDCVNKKGSDMLPFDFYIPSLRLAIEYDGLHHFEPVPGWGGEEKFKKTQENDKIKDDYCLNNNIKLIRIPYTYSKSEIKNTINKIISPVTITAA